MFYTRFLSEIIIKVFSFSYRVNFQLPNMAFSDKKKLSKNLLEMKFMRTSRDRIVQETEDEESRVLFGNISDELKSSSSKYILQPSWAICEGLKCGRRSFRGMNPVIERIMALDEDDKTGVKRQIKEEDVDVTAEEMAKFRQEESTLVETVAKKFRPKNDEPPAKKMKFLKPKDE
ncbi:M-phase phosphoprotein 6 [Planococcus citri]|uniref:M-phase phosphoprotein 6 n=1 Tax=Planococcus citri TaxID=170843 RepID=UPI0031F86753